MGFHSAPQWDAQAQGILGALRVKDLTYKRAHVQSPNPLTSDRLRNFVLSRDDRGGIRTLGGCQVGVSCG